MSKRKLNLSIHEIDLILNAYFKDKVSITQINKNIKVSTDKIKEVIKTYSIPFLSKYPQYKQLDNISVDDYQNHISGNTYTPAKLEIEKRKTITKTKNSDEESPYVS